MAAYTEGMHRRAFLTLTALALPGCSFYMGEPRTPKTEFYATLGGAYEVPPVDTRGNGWMKATYRPATRVLEYQLVVSGLSGPVTMAYLHGPARIDQVAPQVAPINVPFVADRSIVRDGVTLTAQQADEVMAGLWYVNVRTDRFPDGEIRGQLLPAGK